MLFCFVDENDHRELSAKAVSAKWKLKKNCPYWLVSKHCYDFNLSEAESSSEEDEKVSASGEEPKWRLSTRCKIWSTIGLFPNYFSLKSLTLSLKSHMNVL